MQIATWNVNSINARLEGVLDWFRTASPDVACLQEIKCNADLCPRPGLGPRAHSCNRGRP